MDTRLTRLDNGMRVVTSSMPHAQSATLGIWVGAGARYEASELSGISHFIEHLLFKGTRRRSARDISQAIEGRGGYLNAFTQEESTCYYARIPYDQVERSLDVLSDMYMNPRLDPGDIRKERGVIVEEIMMYRDQPHQLVQDMLGQAMWMEHPLGRPVIGTPETLGGMNRTVIRAYLRGKYLPRNTVFAFAGRVDHEHCVREVVKRCGRQKGGPPPTARQVTAAVRQEAVRLMGKDIEQTHLALGIRLFGRDDGRRYPLRILNAVLGENMSSRLFQVVREKHGLAYSVHSSFHLYRETGGLVVSAGLVREKHLKALDLIVREIRRLKDRPVGAHELRRAKDYVIGQVRLGLESTSNQMMWIGDNLVSHGRFISPEETIAALQAVTAEEVQSLAGAVLRRSCASLAIISPGLTAKDETVYRAPLGGL